MDETVFESFPTLETPRLLLRQPVPQDTAAAFAMYSDPQVLRYVYRPVMTSPEQAEQKIASWREDFRTRQGIRWGLALKSEPGRLLGTVAIWRLIREHFRAEVGYDLSPACWGSGLMREALTAVVDFAFQRMRLHSLMACVDPDNEGSIRLLERLGFRREAHTLQDYYHDGQFLDSYYYGLVHGLDWPRP